MVTRVGAQKNFTDVIKELLELEYDALEAYKSAINRLKSENYKLTFEEYQKDHEYHITEISNYLSKYLQDIPKTPSAKQWLTKGKVVLANLMGDTEIIKAMISNESDTNKAYENVLQRQDKWLEIEPFLKAAYSDEKRHKTGLELLVNSMKY